MRVGRVIDGGKPLKTGEKNPMDAAGMRQGQQGAGRSNASGGREKPEGAAKPAEATPARQRCQSLPDSSRVEGTETPWKGDSLDPSEVHIAHRRDGGGSTRDGARP